MEHDIRNEGNVLVVSLRGDVDLEQSPAARKAQTAFALAAVSAGAMRVLELARLNKVFAIHDSLEAGLESLE